MTQFWPGSWALCLAARFHDRTLCTRLLASVTGAFTANMLVKEFIQIDSVFGYAAGIAEMLLQSHNGYIELLPTPAFGWVNGAFRNMRARGGFACDLEWKRDRPCTGTIRSLCGGACAVKALGLKGVRRADGQVVPVSDDDIVRFDSVRGAIYERVF